MITDSIKRERLLQKFKHEALQPSVWMQSGNRTGNIYDLTSEELEDLYSCFFPKAPTVYQEVNNLYTEKLLKSLRSIILKDAQYIGLYDPADWAKFNHFMLKLSPLKKPLVKYTVDEFNELKKQFKSLRSKYDKSAKIPGTKEWYHKNKLPMPSES